MLIAGRVDRRASPLDHGRVRSGDACRWASRAIGLPSKPWIHDAPRSAGRPSSCEVQMRSPSRGLALAWSARSGKASEEVELRARSPRPSRTGHDNHPAMEQVRTLSTVVIADSTGVRPVTTTTDLSDGVATIDFCWLDVSVRDEAVRNDVLAQLGLEASDLSWALRFGQSPRMVIDRRGLRAVTWLAEATGDVTEVHVLCSARGVGT